ncbi:nitroreductase/quinone reductase family protein [Williamsia sterculiae]|uniref:Deazaflavin-dependent oxidoreductase, nitroreductase family n=1 Tax=Williamsia sterculiae TaxID=1344003 RepID=A0A1N7H6L0_9NOCA|nr:nitroreductase/quinone reductase family protein [Williamsia sterculiae]SIS20496.1 deazaflavin-dependent oxidoreductase, nitroreductase family [Williamsia sterculiae]
MTAPTHYRVPDSRMEAAMNALIRRLADRGLGPAGAQSLTVVGRVSGTPQRTPVNPTEVDGRRYLVSPRGNTQWSRNLRVAGTAELGTGRRAQTVRAVEIADAEKVAVLRPYLVRWGWEVGRFLPAGPDGAAVDKNSADEVLAFVAPSIPIFEIHSV